MKLTSCLSAELHSPAFIYDIDQLRESLGLLDSLRIATGCKLLYSIKALPLTALLKQMLPLVDGFSVSSLFEARLAHEVLAKQAGSIHITTPGLRLDEFEEIAALCTHVSFNSLSQMQRLESVASGFSKGLRINPKLSALADPRFDPCRQHSKLGIDIAQLNPDHLTDIEGLHFHNSFAAEDFYNLDKTLQKLLPVLQKINPKWINLGGGYIFSETSELNHFVELIDYLKRRLDIEVFIEPGKSIIGRCGYLVTTVIDKFISDGKAILVVDTSVNHHPEIFEYQKQPQLLAATGAHQAIVAGSSCLAGDILGEYAFDRIPEPGDQLLFADVGAYSLIKASRFNGYNLPDVYFFEDNQLINIKRYDYLQYRDHW